MPIALQIREPHKEPANSEDYQNFANYLKTNIHAQRVMEEELMNLINLRNSVTAKHMVSEEFRQAFAHLDGQIEVYSGLISGEFVIPAALPSQNQEG